MRRWVWALVVAACGTSPAGDAGTPEPFVYRRCAETTRLGGFDVSLEDGYTSVGGRVYDAVLSTRVQDTLATEGACRLAKAPPVSCDPACTGGDVCGVGDVCEAYPSTMSVGAVTVTGLLAPVTMEPIAPVNAYNFAGTLPHPGFAPAADIGLTADGLSLRGFGVEALVVPDGAVAVAEGEPLLLTWTPSDGPARILIDVNLDTHGVNGAHIECEVDDRGSYAVPAALVAELLAGDLSGFPRVAITRASIDAADLAQGCVELRVLSEIVRDLVVPGVESCSDDADCTAPETCQGDLTCG